MLFVHSIDPLPIKCVIYYMTYECPLTWILIYIVSGIFQNAAREITELRKIAFEAENEPTPPSGRRQTNTKDFKKLGFQVRYPLYYVTPSTVTHSHIQLQYS